MTNEETPQSTETRDEPVSHTLPNDVRGCEGCPNAGGCAFRRRLLMLSMRPPTLKPLLEETDEGGVPRELAA